MKSKIVHCVCMGLVVMMGCVIVRRPGVEAPVACRYEVSRRKEGGGVGTKEKEKDVRG